MLHILRAFAWVRWRVLVNSLERTGARDTLERFSIAIQQISPIIALVLFVPSSIASAGVGAAAGYTLAGGNARPLLLEIARFLLLAATALCIVGPIAMPAADRTNPVRLLLLPIARPILYIAQTAGTLTDPWILLTVPLVLVLPFGLAVGGAFSAAAVALAAGILLIGVVVGLTALATSILHLIVRDRRRGELIALIFILVVPMLGLIPALSQTGRQERQRRIDGKPRPRPAWARVVRRAAPYLPSELYVSAVRQAATGSASTSAQQVAALGATAVGLHAVGLAIYRRVLDSPGSTGASRRAPRRQWSLRVPGVSAGTSAVALSQLRVAARTPRGRSMLLSPLIVLIMFGALMYRGSGDMELGFIALESGVGLAAFGGAAALLSILPIAMNQFAIDRAGLTLALLSPLSDRELLVGKAIGNGLIVAATSLVCLAGAAVVFPGGSPWLWLSVPIALAATYILVTPLAAALSAIFPRAVDMNSIGRGSNAHGAAGTLGFLAFMLAGVPSALTIVLATRVLRQPALAPLLLVLWLAICLVIAVALFVPVRRLFARRRENLAMIV